MYRKNNERGSLNPSKEDALFTSIAGVGKPKTYKDVARMFNVTEEYVKGRVMLLKIHPDVFEKVPQGTFFRDALGSCGLRALLVGLSEGRAPYACAEKCRATLFP